MRTLSVYYTHKPGGFCTRLYRLLNGLSAREFEVHYLTLDRPPDILDSKVKVHKIPFPTTERKGLLFWAMFTAWCPLYSAWIALKLRPKRYVVFGAYYGSILALARLVNWVPLILFIRSLVFKIDEITKKNSLVRFISCAVDKVGILTATKVVCMTESMRHEIEKFIGKNLSNVTILPNDVPPVSASSTNLSDIMLPEVQSQFDNQTTIVLTSGVIDQRKNIDYLIEVFVRLQETYSAREILLFVAGAGPLLQHYKNEVLIRKIKNIFFLGWCESLAPLLRRAQVVVHPSLHEGMPNSVMEALAYEVPVLGGDIPEMRELLVEPGLLFDLSNPATLVKILQEIRSEPVHVIHLKEACRARARVYSFDWEERAATLLS